MATNVADLLVGERGKNSSLTANSNSVSGILNQGNSAAIASAQSLQTGVEELKQQQIEALAARQNAARVAFDTVAKQQTALADELAAVNVRTAQTKEMEGVLLAEQNKKAADVAQHTVEVNNTSFFRNPIQWFSTRSKLNDAKGGLQKTSEALIQVHNTIDDEYSVAGRNFRNFQSSKTMIAQRQAELDAKLVAEKESLDVSLAAQKSEADTKALQVIATQLKVNPLAVKEGELNLELAYRTKVAEIDKKAKEVYGVDAFMAAYNLNTADPKTRLHAAASYEQLTPEERHKWNSVELALVSSKKPLNAESVLSEFKVRNDVDGYLKVIEASDPELHQEIMRGVGLQAQALGEQKDSKGKTVRAKMLEDLTLANTTATGKNKLTPQQIEAKVQKDLFSQASAGGIEGVLQAGTTEVRQKLSAIGSRASQDVLDGNSVAQWAEQVDGISPLVIEALKSPNTILAYDTGHKVGDKLSAIDPQASRVVAGVDKLVAMGVKEEEAVKAYSTIMKKAAEGYIRAIPEGKFLLDRYKKFGIEIPLSSPVPSIDLNFSIFGGAALRPTEERMLDLFNPTDLQNFIARVRKQSQADTFNSYQYSPTIPRF